MQTIATKHSKVVVSVGQGGQWEEMGERGFLKKIEV